MNEENLKKEIRKIICDTLEIENFDISDSENFANSKFHFDSIDVLELEFVIKKKYSINIEKMPREIFHSIQSIADFIINYHQEQK